MKDLPITITGSDFEHLPVGSLDELKAAYAAVAGAKLGQAYLNFEVR
jgi:hypothetical protein